MPEAQATVAAVEAEPARVSVRFKLSGALLGLLETEPKLCAELDPVLRESGTREAVMQSASVTEDWGPEHDGSNGRSAQQGRHRPWLTAPDLPHAR